MSTKRVEQGNGDTRHRQSTEGHMASHPGEPLIRDGHEGIAVPAVTLGTQRFQTIGQCADQAQANEERNLATQEEGNDGAQCGQDGSENVDVA